MKRHTRLTLIGTAVACSAAATPQIQGGGISLYEIATPDVGLASAGYAARADDASTLFKNPAGMSRLADLQFQGGLQALYGSVSFSPDANTSPGLSVLTCGGPGDCHCRQDFSLSATQSLASFQALTPPRRKH